MKNSMKIVGTMICFMTLAGLATAQEAPESQANQQQEKRLPHEVANPEKIATRITEQMQRSLQLTEKQYNKIYKLNLKEQKKRFSAMQNSERPNPPMDRPHGMGGGRPPMMGGEPPAMGGGRPDRGENSQREDKAEEMQEAVAAKQKKIKKILTTEQYEKWQEIGTRQKDRHPQRSVMKEGDNG